MDKCKQCCYLLEGTQDSKGERRMKCVRKNTYLDTTDHPRCKSFRSIESTVPEHLREAFRRIRRNLTNLS